MVTSLGPALDPIHVWIVIWTTMTPELDPNSDLRELGKFLLLVRVGRFQQGESVLQSQLSAWGIVLERHGMRNGRRVCSTVPFLQVHLSPPPSPLCPAKLTSSLWCSCRPCDSLVSRSLVI